MALKQRKSADLVNKLAAITLGPDECFISYDVTALFTSVPVPESLIIIEERLKSDDTLSDRTNLSAEQITSLLRVCLTSNYFVFDGKFYTQTHGAAMGSPVSPIVANLYVEDFEEKALNSFPHSIKFWGRYVDDTICVILRALVSPFTDHINSQDP